MHFNMRCHISVNLYVHFCARKLLHELSFCTVYTLCELYLWIIIQHIKGLCLLLRLFSSIPTPSLMNQYSVFICFIARDLLCMVTVKSTT